MRLALGAGLAAVVLAVVIVLASGGRGRKAVASPAPGGARAEVAAPELEAPEVTDSAPTSAADIETAAPTPERAALDVDELVGYARLSGLVQSWDGKRLAGARVRVGSFERRAGKPRFSYATTTGEKGDFRFEVGVGAAAAAGAGQEYLIHASHPGYRTATLLTPPMRAGLGVARDLVLDPRVESLVEVEVLVRDEAGPVLGANVLLFDEIPSKKSEATILVRIDSRVTDEEGRALLGSPVCGRKVIVVAARQLGFQVYRDELFVANPGRATHEALLEKGLAIAGVVRSTDGELHGGIKLRLDPEAELEAEQILVASKAGGLFRAEGVAPGVHKLESLADQQLWSPFRIEVAAGQEDLELVLKRPSDPMDHGLHLGEIHGTVLLPARIEAPFPHGVWIEPVSTADREALERDVLPNLVRSGRGVVTSREMPVIRGGKTEYRVLRPDGLMLATNGNRVDFHFVGLEDGDYCVFATHPETSPAIAGPFSIRDGSLLNGIRLELPATASVSGRVLDPKGVPVPGALLIVTGSGAASDARIGAVSDVMKQRAPFRDPPALSDADGFFTIESVPTEIPVVVVALRRGMRSAQSSALRLAPGEAATGLQLVLEMRQ